MNHLADGTEIPMGLGMALAQNLSAMHYFADLPQDKQHSIIQQTHKIQSKEEMQAFVASLAGQN